MTLVSIIMPTRNRRRLLSEAVASVLVQEGANWELIIVDDASTDQTRDYIASLNDVRVFSTRHDEVRRVSAARNTGLAMARGDYVMFVDDDDLLRPNAVAALSASLDAHPDACAASAACRLYHEDGDSSRVYRPSKVYSRNIWRELLFGWWSNSGQNIYRTAIVREIGGFDTELNAAEDRWLWLQVSKRGNVCLIPATTLEYRQHFGQSTKVRDYETERQIIWARYIASLAMSRQREARRIRRAATLVDNAESARHASRFWLAARLHVAAILVAPRLLASPLVGRPIYWNIKKCLQRRARP